MRRLAPGALRIDVEHVAGYPCLRLCGEGDFEAAARLERLLEELIDDGCVELVLDLREVQFLNVPCSEILESAGARILEEGGTLVVVDQSLPVERTLKLGSLEQVAHVAPTVRQAVAYLGRAP